MIWNCDKTGIQFAHKPKQGIAKKATRTECHCQDLPEPGQHNNYCVHKCNLCGHATNGDCKGEDTGLPNGLQHDRWTSSIRDHLVLQTIGLDGERSFSGMV